MGIFNWLRSLLTFDPSVYKPPVDSIDENSSGMTEGDFRSGPEGYSPSSSYPEAFYGGASDEGPEEGEFRQ